MKKRILLVNGHLNVGGVEKSLVSLLRHLDYGKYEVDLLLLEDEGDYIHEIPQEVLVIFKDLTNTYGSVKTSLKRCLAERDWLCFRMRLISLLVNLFNKRCLKLANRLLLGRAVYDCAIGYRPGICSDLVAYAIKAPKKMTWWHHGELNMNAVQLAEYEQVCNRFDNIVAVSDGCAEILRQAIPGIAGKVTVIPNILDVLSVQTKAELFNPCRHQSKLRFVTVGRLSPEKHVENAVYAAERLIQWGLTDFTWHIIGDGEDRGKIENLICDKQLQHVFSMEGSLPNPYPYMKRADLYVHTSYVESFGLTILEAMALSVPCVVTRSLGPESYIRNGENGILVEKNTESLAMALLNIIQSPDIFATLRTNTCCPSRFFPENVIRGVEAVIGD